MTPRTILLLPKDTRALTFLISYTLVILTSHIESSVLFFRIHWVLPKKTVSERNTVFLASCSLLFDFQGSSNSPSPDNDPLRPQRCQAI